MVMNSIERLAPMRPQDETTGHEAYREGEEPLADLGGIGAEMFGGEE